MSKPSKTARAKVSAKRTARKPRRASTAKRAKSTKTTRATAKQATTIRETSKLANVIALLQRKEGATIEQLSEATGWQSHSIRGAISGAIKKKLGLTVSSAKEDGIRTYRITT